MNAKKSITLFLIIFLFVQCNRNQGNKNESDLAKTGVPIKVSDGDSNTSFSYYNTSPESPDGKYIAYTKFLSSPKEERYEKVPAEIWVCNSDLSNHRKVVSINDIAVHNGARVQWLDNNSFAFEDDSIRAVNLDGKALIKPLKGRLGHETHNGKILYSDYDSETGISTIYEYDIPNKKIDELADVSDFQRIKELYPNDDLRETEEMWILHLQYSPDGSKIAFRLDIGPRNEKYNHLVIMNKDGSNVNYFGPKPMHFSWFDNESIMGHDNQIEDGYPNDNNGRRWDFERNVLETLSGPGNHFAASPNRNLIASESWYRKNPVILQIYERGELRSFWQDTVSTDKHTTWTLAYHTNPSFSRDGKRVYFNNCTAPGKVYAYMVNLPENEKLKKTND